MDIANHKFVRCNRVGDQLFLSVSPNSGDWYSSKRLLRLSFWRGELHCSTDISKDEAREFAHSILELLEALDEPNPDQQSIDFPQQEAA